jgi:glycerate 2-kinase
MADAHRRALLEIFSAALLAVNGRHRVREFLARQSFAAPLYIIAVGKAACSMALGAHDALGDAVRGGFVVTKHNHAEPLPWPVCEASHPVPDATSLRAGARLLEYTDQLPLSAQVLVLLSGGASALVEQLPEGVRLDSLQQLNEWLLASGRDIAAVNRIRKRLSLIKGGRLAQRLAPRRVTCLALSDVPGDDARFIGSGPLVADASLAQESIDDAPAELRALLERAPPLPAPSDPCFANIHFHIVAGIEHAKRAAAHAAAERGLHPMVLPDLIAGDAVATGTRLAHTILTADAGTLLVGAGETTVRLPPNPGRGGRNQALALAAARALAGHTDVLLLAAGTDGTDGPTPDAGALVDGGTIDRGTRAGFDVTQALVRADAGTFLEASGDLIRTGPTGTNVMDLVLALRVPR